MSWEAIAAISQAAGFIVVVISLLYLALQIKFARLTAADTSRTARAIGVRENVLTMVNNTGLRENWIKSSGLNSEYEMLGKEMGVGVDGAIQVDNMCQSWMWLHWGQYKSIKTEDDHAELESIMSAFYSVPPMIDCWRKSPYGKAVFDTDYVKFVEDAISKGKN